MARLDTDRQNQLEPIRLGHARKMIEGKGYDIAFDNGKMIEFVKDGHRIKFFPYSGWATGKTIKDGRGLQNLLRQL
jgi:hypothetical protein